MVRSCCFLLVLSLLLPNYVNAQKLFKFKERNDASNVYGDLNYGGTFLFVVSTYTFSVREKVGDGGLIIEQMNDGRCKYYFRFRYISSDGVRKDTRCELAISKDLTISNYKWLAEWITPVNVLFSEVPIEQVICLPQDQVAIQKLILGLLKDATAAQGVSILQHNEKVMEVFCKDLFTVK